jgi:hypothetical protein
MILYITFFKVLVPRDGWMAGALQSLERENGAGNAFKQSN